MSFDCFHNNTRKIIKYIKNNSVKNLSEEQRHYILLYCYFDVVERYIVNLLMLYDPLVPIKKFKISIKCLLEYQDILINIQEQYETFDYKENFVIKSNYLDKNLLLLYLHLNNSELEFTNEGNIFDGVHGEYTWLTFLSYETNIFLYDEISNIIDRFIDTLKTPEFIYDEILYEFYKEFSDVLDRYYYDARKEMDLF